MLPRWFLLAITGCVIVATLALIYFAYDAHHWGRYTFHNANGATTIMDTRTGYVCSVPSLEGSPATCAARHQPPSLDSLKKKYGVSE